MTTTTIERAVSAKVLFTGKTHVTAGPNGAARSSDGYLDVKLPQPHPAAENLFGAAWSACYIGAIELAAAQKKVKLPAHPEVDAEIDLNKAGNSFSECAPQRQRAGRGPRRRAGAHRGRALDLPVLQGDARQYRRCYHAALIATGLACVLKRAGQTPRRRDASQTSVPARRT